MFEFWREATAASVAGLLCQPGRRRPENVSILKWLDTVLREVSGNSRDGECYKLNKQTWRRTSNGTQTTIFQNLLIKIL